jgi:hypothetical protein
VGPHVLLLRRARYAEGLFVLYKARLPYGVLDSYVYTVFSLYKHGTRLNEHSGSFFETMPRIGLATWRGQALQGILALLGPLRQHLPELQQGAGNKVRIQAARYLLGRAAWPRQLSLSCKCSKTPWQKKAGGATTLHDRFIRSLHSTLLSCQIHLFPVLTSHEVP